MILGQIIDASLLLTAKYVHVRGVKKGKGFQGVVARYSFNRGPSTHGSKHHRAPGSVGAGTDPGRVFPGTRMAGRDDSKYATVRSLRLLALNPKQNLVLVRGSVPGWDMRSVLRVKWERWRDEVMDDRTRLLEKERLDRFRLIGGGTAGIAAIKNPLHISRSSTSRSGKAADCSGGEKLGLLKKRK